MKLNELIDVLTSIKTAYGNLDVTIALGSDREMGKLMSSEDIFIAVESPDIDKPLGLCLRNFPY